MSRSLTDLAPAESGRIVALEGAASEIQRLRDMGLTRGARVEVVRVAPLGDPMELRVRGFILTLRKHEAAGVRVEP
ncbi:MAG TPA: FeoA family protein [Gemmatimonadales bacterium]|nr:FeoA family protein [Gemmatimonadales bacterium]